jgi:hypothetical protein
MKKQEVRALIEKIGIVPVVRAASPQEARFAAEAVWQGGIPIVEITMTVPRALDVISELVKMMPELLVGAGTVVSRTYGRIKEHESASRNRGEMMKNAEAANRLRPSQSGCLFGSPPFSISVLKTTS